MKISELQSKPPKILLYGPFGQGKTAFVQTLGKDGLLLDLDQGARTGLSLKDQNFDLRQNIEVEQFPEDIDNPKAFSDMKARVLKISSECARGTFPFKALIVDGLTAMSEYAMKYILKNQGQVSKPPRIQDWGLAITEIENILYILRALPLLVVVTAHDQSEMVDEQTQKKILIYGRALPDKIPTYFDEVWYAKVRDLAAGKRKFCIQTTPTSSIPARSRLGLPDGTEMDLGFHKVLSVGNFDLNTFNSPKTRKEKQDAAKVKT